MAAPRWIALCLCVVFLCGIQGTLISAPSASRRSIGFDSQKRHGAHYQTNEVCFADVRNDGVVYAGPGGASEGIPPPDGVGKSAAGKPQVAMPPPPRGDMAEYTRSLIDASPKEIGQGYPMERTVRHGLRRMEAITTAADYVAGRIVCRASSRRFRSRGDCSRGPLEGTDGSTRI